MQVVILHKEIADKIAGLCISPKHRSPRAAGSRRRAAQKKRPMGLFIPQVIGPLIIEHCFGTVPVLFKGLLIGVIANLIHVEHYFVPLSFICLYYSTLLEVCQVLFFNFVNFFIPIKPNLPTHRAIFRDVFSITTRTTIGANLLNLNPFHNFLLSSGGINPPDTTECNTHHWRGLH